MYCMIIGLFSYIADYPEIKLSSKTKTESGVVSMALGLQQGINKSGFPPSNLQSLSV